MEERGAIIYVYLFVLLTEKREKEEGGRVREEKFEAGTVGLERRSKKM